jgi:hypothetical protein
MRWKSDSIFSDLEKLSEDNKMFLSNNSRYSFRINNADVSQKEKYFGKNSVCIDYIHPFSLNLSLHIHPNDLITASIWRLAGNDSCCMVFTNTDSHYFYKSQNKTDSVNINGWKKIDLSFNVPDDYKDSILDFYIYNYGHTHAFFDDVSLSINKALHL